MKKRREEFEISEPNTRSLAPTEMRFRYEDNFIIKENPGFREIIHLKRCALYIIYIYIYIQGGLQGDGANRLRGVHICSIWTEDGPKDRLHKSRI